MLTRVINVISQQYLREEKEANDSAVSKMERRGVLSTVDKRRASTIRHGQMVSSRSVIPCSPSQVCDTDRHGEGYASLDLSTRTSSSPCEYNGDIGEDATGCDDGTNIRNASVASGSCIQNSVSSNGHRSAENHEGSTEFHIIRDDSNADREEACGDIGWCGEGLSGGICISELVDNLEGISVFSGTKIVC
jgi:hypothetical protein